MEIPTDFDMSKILPLLQSFGVSPTNLSPEKLSKLQRLSEKVQKPEQISIEMSQQIMEIMGISVKGNSSPVNRKVGKVGRNDICPCGSGKKSKKCCSNNNTIKNHNR